MARRAKGEGCIFERGEKFLGKITINGATRYKTFPTKDEVLDWFNQLRQDSKNPAPEIDSAVPISFADLAASYKVDRMGGWRPATFSHFKYHVEKVLVGHFGEQAIASISPNSIRKFLVEKRGQPRLSNGTRKDPVKAVTVNKLHSWLKWLFAFAVRHDWLEKSPMVRVAKVPVPKDEKYRARVLKLGELRAFFSACLPEYRNFFVILFFTGLRRSEIFRLVWEGVDLEDSVLCVNGKTMADDSVPLAAPAKAAFEAFGLRREGLVFPGRAQKDKEIDPKKRMTNRHKAIQSTLKRAKINPAGVSLHTFRRTFMTLLEKVGARHGVIRRLGRHGERSVTDRYVLPDDDELRAALAKLADAVFPPESPEKGRQEGQLDPAVEVGVVNNKSAVE